MQKFYWAILALVISFSGSTHADGKNYLSFKTEDEANNIEIYKKASRSVVFVTNNELMRSRYSYNVQEVPRGSGTGFVWSKEGYIVTNFHVIQSRPRSQSKIVITLQDQSSYEAEIVGQAPSKDLAVLKIDAPKDKLFPLPLGNSSQLEVGRKVIAIGNPFGLDTTMTVGVVSALGREIESFNRRMIRDVIQTDAAINPGNSGGPLLNSLGQVVGVNTQIYSPSGASAGIGFAIPSNTVKRFVPQLIEHGRVVRPTIGIELVNQNWYSQYGIEGVIVGAASPGGPAEKAGMTGVKRTYSGWRLGDVITEIDGKRIATTEDLFDALESRKPGDRVTVKTLRNDEEKTFKITLSGYAEQ